MDQENEPGPRRSRSHYNRLLGGAPSAAAEGFESASAAEPDLSDKAITGRVDATRSELSEIVKAHLGDDPALHEIAEQIAREGQAALRTIREASETESLDAGTLNALEVIVRTDGSRPSFMVRNGEPDRSTSPIGHWTATLDDSRDLLRDALKCVGRIDDPSAGQGFQGTGTLIGKNVVMTNRHVLQAVARQVDGKWQLKPDIAVDFGHEFRARESIDRRTVKGVLFAGARPIVPTSIDHAKLDLALLELEPAAGPGPQPLALDSAADWGQPETGVFICGYPGNPGFVETPSLLEKLFRSTYGCKRVAPGLVMTPAAKMPDSPRGWTLGHDGTTLGGNSGSIVIVISRETVGAGLHYGGRRSDPRENWCHILGLTLDEPDDRGTTLREILQTHEVALVDRLSG